MRKKLKKINNMQFPRACNGWVEKKGPYKYENLGYEFVKSLFFKENLLWGLILHENLWLLNPFLVFSVIYSIFGCRLYPIAALCMFLKYFIYHYQSKVFKIVLELYLKNCFILFSHLFLYLNVKHKIAILKLWQF